MLDLLCISFCISCRCTYTHTCQYQLAINSGRTVHNDFTCQVWSRCVKLHTAECNGHREFQVSSDKWPRLAVDQQTRGLSDLSLHQQTLLQPLGSSTGCCTLWVSPHFLTLHFSSVSLFPFLLITCNSKPKSNIWQTIQPRRCHLSKTVPGGGWLAFMQCWYHSHVVKTILHLEFSSVAWVPLTKGDSA